MSVAVSSCGGLMMVGGVGRWRVESLMLEGWGRGQGVVGCVGRPSAGARFFLTGVGVSLSLSLSLSLSFFLSLCVRVCVCVYIYIYICVCVCMYVCMYVCM